MILATIQPEAPSGRTSRESPTIISTSPASRLPSASFTLYATPSKFHINRLIRNKVCITTQRLYALMSLPPVVELAPGIGAVYWRSKDMAMNQAENQLTSTSRDILSVIQLQLLPGLSVLDISSPAGKTWQATLEYVSTIPGQTSFLWGTGNEKGDLLENICLLIQWESPLRWKEFQASMGLSLMVGLLRENPWNRCMHVSLQGLSITPKALKLFWRNFKSDEFTDEGGKLDENWRALKESWTEQSIGESCVGDWLEEDGGMISVHSKDPGPQIAAVKAQDRVFCVLRFEEAEEQDSERVENEISGLLGEVAVNRKFLLLEPVKSQPQMAKHPFGNGNRFTVNSLSSLAQLVPCRQYSAYNYITFNIDGLQDKRRMAEPPQSQFPGPHGDYTQMGSIHQYMRPALPYLEEQDHLIADIIYLNFKPGVIDSDRSVKKTFSDLRYEIKEMEGCSGLVWCRPDRETSYDCILFIYWKKGAVRSTYFEAVQNLIRQFNQMTSSLTREPYFHSLKPRYSLPGSLVEFFPLLEVTTFKISDSPYGRKLFRRYYESFERTTDLNLRSGSVHIKRAGVSAGYFLHGRPLTSSLYTNIEQPDGNENDNQGELLLTSLMAWSSVEAMEEWYTEFAEGCDIYERLGHKIDALRLFCDNVDSVKSTIWHVIKDPYRPSRRGPGFLMGNSI